MAVIRNNKLIKGEAKDILIKLIEDCVLEIIDVHPHVDKNDLQDTVGRVVWELIWASVDGRAVDHKYIERMAMPKRSSAIWPLVLNSIEITAREFVNHPDVQADLDDYYEAMEQIKDDYGM